MWTTRKKDNDAKPALAVDIVYAARHYKWGTGVPVGSPGHYVVCAGCRNVANYDRTHVWTTWRTMAEECLVSIGVAGGHSGDVR